MWHGKPDIVCITETWLCNNIYGSECTIPGYNCIRCDRNRHGGGVALFICNVLEFHVTMCGPMDLEFLLVSVFSANNANERIYIGIWYRPPANSVALDDLYSVLTSLDASIFSSFVLLGDYNFCNHQHPLFSKLSSFLHSFVLTQVVPQPTQFNPNGTTSLFCHN